MVRRICLGYPRENPTFVVAREAIDALHTSNRVKRGDLALLPCTSHRGETTGRICLAADLHGNRSLLPLVVGVPYSSRVAVQLLYKGNDKKSLKPLVALREYWWV